MIYFFQFFRHRHIGNGVLLRHVIGFSAIELLDRRLLKDDCTVFSEAQTIGISEYARDNPFITVIRFPPTSVMPIDNLH
jgi:hypothetical protein